MSVKLNIIFYLIANVDQRKNKGLLYDTQIDSE